MPLPLRVNTARLHWQLTRARFLRAGLRERIFEGRCGRIRYWEGGVGEPMLLLHGFGGDAVVQWHPQVGALAEVRRLIVPDLMFFGGSSSPSRERGLEFQARAVLELADALALPAFDLAGISYGGFVSYALAGASPRRVRRLILVDSPGPVMRREDYWDLLLRFDVGSVADLLLPETSEDVRRLIGLAWVRPPPIPGFALDDARRFLFLDQVEEKRALLEALAGVLQFPPDPFPIHHSTLVLWGREDRVFPVELGERLAATLGPRARLQIMEGTAHAPNQEKPREFNRIVRRFLAEPAAPVEAEGANMSFR